MHKEEWDSVKSYTHRKPVELLGERIKTHWHFREKLYSVSVYVPKVGWRAIYNPDVLDPAIPFDWNIPYQQMLGKVVLKDVEFKVSKGGRQRARKEYRRNVHAWVIGTLVDFTTYPNEPYAPCADIVGYSPFAYDDPCFKVMPFGQPMWTPDADPIHEAKLVSMGVKNDKPQILAVR